MRSNLSAVIRIVLLHAALLLGCAAQAAETRTHFEIPAGAAPDTLRQFMGQSKMQLLFDFEAVRGLVTRPVSGELEATEALSRMLAGTGFTIEKVNERTVTIRQRPADGGGATQGVTASRQLHLVSGAAEERTQRAQSQATVENERGGAGTGEGKDTVPEILVKGAKTFNVDIQRSEDAPQPYVIFDREEIGKSQAVNVEDFLRTRLPMNASNQVVGQNTGTGSTFSTINLRGLGSNQTLILVDGRRLPGASAQGAPFQPDLNGIPLAAIERIEVLPSTAGGIYGGSATGGVVNVVLRRDFRGIEGKATYANTFDTDTGNLRLDANAGFSLENGRTQVTIAAAHSDANSLLVGDRDFAKRLRRLQLKNNPASVTGSSTPPLGATVNIRASTNLVLDNGTPLGSNITHVPIGYEGTDNGVALVGNAGSYNLDLAKGVAGTDRGLLATPSIDSVSANVRREFTQTVDAFVDLSHLVNNGLSFTAGIPGSVTLRSDAPNNPFQQAINVRFPVPNVTFPNKATTTTERATAGLIFRLPRNWTSEIDYGWSRSRYEQSSATTVLDFVGNCVLSSGYAAGVDPDGAGPRQPCNPGDTRPALNVMQDGNTHPLDFTPYMLPLPNLINGPYDTILKDATLRLSGSLFRLPGGPLGISALLETRTESLKDAFFQNVDYVSRLPTYTFFPHSSQRADSAYIEALAPLFSHSNARPGLQELELQFSIRRDEYTTRANPDYYIPIPSPDESPSGLVYSTNRAESTDYTLGLRYAPVRDLTFRASFGTGFLPPDVTQVAPAYIDYDASLGSDPKRGGTPMWQDGWEPFTLIYNGSPTLKPERSKSLSAGFIYTPQFVPDFRLSVDYTRIRKVDEIQYPLEQYLLDNEDKYPGRIIRGANLDTDEVGWAGPIISFDETLLNLSSTKLEMFDIQADYTQRTARLGEYHWYAIATRQVHYQNQFLPGDSPVESVGYHQGPLPFRGNFGLNWTKGSLGLNWNAQYYSAYIVYPASSFPATINSLVRSQGTPEIPSQIYHDLIATYAYEGGRSGWMGAMLADTEISIGIQNVLNTSPPLQVSTLQVFGGYSTYGDPRLRRYSIAFRKSFGNAR